MPVSFSQIINEESIPSQIRLTKGVEFVGIINNQGRIENYVCDADISLIREKKEMFYMSVVLQHKMLGDFDDDFEAIKYTVTERGKSKFVTIPFFSKIIFIKMKKEINHLRLINKIFAFFLADKKNPDFRIRQ